jgi:hypothetical protein
MVVLVGEPAVAALAAPPRVAQERRGEGAGGERFPAPLRPGEDVRVMGTFGGAAEERHRSGLAGHAIQHREAHGRTLTRASDDVSRTA